MFQVAMNVEGFLKPRMPTLLRADSWEGRSLSSNPRASSWRFTPVLRPTTASRGAPGASARKEGPGSLGHRASMAGPSRGGRSDEMELQ